MSLIIREMHIKPTRGDITSHLSEWLLLIHQQTPSVGEDVEKGGPFYTVGGHAD